MAPRRTGDDVNDILAHLPDDLVSAFWSGLTGEDERYLDLMPDETRTVLGTLVDIYLQTEVGKAFDRAATSALIPMDQLSFFKTLTRQQQDEGE